MSLILFLRDKSLRVMVSPLPEIGRDELAAEVRAYDRLHRILYAAVQEAKTTYN